MKSSASFFVRQLLLAATISLGIGTIWLVLALFVGTLVVEAWQGPDSNWPPRQLLAVKHDGTPLIKSIPRSTPLDATYSDTSGRTVPAPPVGNLIEPVYVFGGDWTQTSWLNEISWQTRLKSFVEPEHPSVIWYFVHDGKPDGAGYFAGYDRSTNRPVGFVGDSGFRPDRPSPDQQFPVSSSLMATLAIWSPSGLVNRGGQVAGSDPDASRIRESSVYVPAGNRLRLVDLRTRSVSTVFETPEPIESFGLCPQETAGKDDPARQPAVAVRTTHTIVALTPRHELLGTFTVPAKLQDSYMIAWYAIGKIGALAEFYHPWQTDPGENLAPRTICSVAPDGTMRSQTDLTLQSGMPVWSKQQESTLLVAALPAPLVLPIAEWFFVSLINQAPTISAGVRMMIESSWPSLLGVALLGLLLSIASWRRSRAFGLPLPHQVAWAIFVFLFGIPGYAGYRLHRRWATLAECPHCHHRAPRDREACAACRAAFPAPAPKGIEIFA